jgi:hypothetical protein
MGQMRRMAGSSFPPGRAPTVARVGKGTAPTVARVGRGAGAPGAWGAKNERPGAGRGALRKNAGGCLNA